MTDEPDADIDYAVQHLRMIQGCTCTPEVLYSPLPFGGMMLHLQHESFCQTLCRLNAQWN